MQVYFVDHNNRTTQFTDPRLNSQILTALLQKQQRPATATAAVTNSPPSLPAVSINAPTTVTNTTSVSTPPVSTTSTAVTVSNRSNTQTSESNTRTPRPVIMSVTTVSSPAVIPSTDSTQTESPPNSQESTDFIPKFRRDLASKLKVLRTELTAMQPQSGHCRLEVNIFFD